MKYLFNINDEKTEFKADYGQLLNYFKEKSHDEISNSFSYLNKNRILEELRDSVKFKGGNFTDIFKDIVIDTKQHLDAKATKCFVNKRKRFLSEHDGDYVHDRRYDINFMESARREKVEGNNLIKINATASFSAIVNASDINLYAKEICELVNYFEATGKSVELNINYNMNNAYYNAPLSKIFITVKRPDKYISKADIYRAISSVFFRYIGFCCIILVAEANKKEVHGGLGTPVVSNNKIEVTPDCINIFGLTKDLTEKVKNEYEKLN